MCVYLDFPILSAVLGHIQSSDVSNSLSALWDSPSFLECIYSGRLIWTQVLYSSPGSVRSLLSAQCDKHTHTHIRAAHPDPVPPHTHTHSLGHPDLRSERPTVAMGTISTPSALLRFAWSKAICPLPILHSSSVPHPLPLFLLSKTEGKKSHPPFSRGMTIPSPILSLKFIHPQCLAPAISSPPSLTPTLYNLYKCVYTQSLAPSTDWERDGVGVYEERICCFTGWVQCRDLISPHISLGGITRSQSDV